MVVSSCSQGAAVAQLCAWKRLPTSLPGEMQDKRTKHRRGALKGPEGRIWAAAALGPATAKPGLAGWRKWRKWECISTAWRGKINIMTCSPPRVLENVMVSDSMDRDIFFP